MSCDELKILGGKMVFCRFFLMMVFSMILTVSINVDAKVKVTSYDMTSAIKVSSKTSGVNGSVLLQAVKIIHWMFWVFGS